MFGGVGGLDCPEEFVELSQPPDEHRDDISPSLARASRDEDLDDLPEEPPLDEPPLDELVPAVVLVALLS